MKRCACKCPHMDSLRLVYAHSKSTALPVLTLVIVVATAINSRRYSSSPYIGRPPRSSSAFADTRDTNDHLGFGNRWNPLVLLKQFASSSPQLASSQSQSTIFDQILIAEGEDEGLMRDAFKEIQIATSPSDRDRWTISDDRKGLERKFEFKSFAACWVRLDSSIGDMGQYGDIGSMGFSQSSSHRQK